MGPRVRPLSVISSCNPIPPPAPMPNLLILASCLIKDMSGRDECEASTLMEERAGSLDWEIFLGKVSAASWSDELTLTLVLSPQAIVVFRPTPSLSIPCNGDEGKAGLELTDFDPRGLRL